MLVTALFLMPNNVKHPVESLTVLFQYRIRLYDLRKGSLDTDYVGGVVASLNFTRDGQCVLVSH